MPTCTVHRYAVLYIRGSSARGSLLHYHVSTVLYRTVLSRLKQFPELGLQQVGRCLYLWHMAAVSACTCMYSRPSKLLLGGVSRSCRTPLHTPLLDGVRELLEVLTGSKSYGVLRSTE